MPLVLVDTAGSASANTYVSLANAETYMLARPFSAAWAAASSTDAVKNQALVFATQLLDRLKWAGAKGITTTGALTQALAWPRRWAPTLEADADPQFISTDFIDTSIAFYDSTTVPAPIVSATVELAVALINAGSTDPFDTDVQRVKIKTVDVLTTEYFASQDQLRGLSRFPHVMQIIGHILRSAEGMEVGRA